jgi:hypothetical protein
MGNYSKGKWVKGTTYNLWTPGTWHFEPEPLMKGLNPRERSTPEKLPPGLNWLIDWQLKIPAWPQWASLNNYYFFSYSIPADKKLGFVNFKTTKLETDFQLFNSVRSCVGPMSMLTTEWQRERCWWWHLMEHINNNLMQLGGSLGNVPQKIKNF